MLSVPHSGKCALQDFEAELAEFTAMPTHLK